MRVTLLVCAFALLTSLSGRASADIVNYDFELTVVEANGLPPDYVGKTAGLSLLVDSDIDSDPDPEVGRYKSTLSFSFDHAGINTTESLYVSFSVRDTPTSGSGQRDAISIEFTKLGPLGTSGFGALQFWMYLTADNGAISSVSPPDADLFTAAQVLGHFIQGACSYSDPLCPVVFSVTAGACDDDCEFVRPPVYLPVSEPEAIALLLAGLGALLAVRGKRV